MSGGASRTGTTADDRGARSGGPCRNLDAPNPAPEPSQVVQAFERLGWRVVRRKGSHIILTKPGQIATLSVPDHSHVARGTLRALLTRAGVPVDEFLAAV